MSNKSKEVETLQFEEGEWILVKELEKDNWEKRQFIEMDETGKLYGCINIWNQKITYWEIAKKLSYSQN